MNAKVATRYQSHLSIAPRISAELPSFSSPLYDQIHFQITLFNQSALYSIKIDHQYRALSKQIKQESIALKNAKETAEIALKFKTILMLEQKRKKLSSSLNSFIEHNRWAKASQEQAFWQLQHKNVIAGSQISVSKLHNTWSDCAQYANHDAHALEYAAKHSQYCQSQIANAIKNFSKLRRSYTDEQRKLLAQYLNHTQAQFIDDQKNLCSSMLMRIKLVLKTGRSDPIEQLITKLQHCGSLDDRAKLIYGTQPSATTRELKFFCQYILQHGTVRHLQELSSIIQKYSGDKFRLEGTISSPEFYPTEFKRLYTKNSGLKNPYSLTRRFYTNFLKKQQHLLPMLLFMPKVTLGKNLPANQNAEAVWEDLTAIQKMLEQNHKSMTWQEKLFRIFSANFRELNKQWDTYLQQQQHTLIELQLTYLENILYNSWKDANAAVVEDAKQLEKLESRLETCFSSIHQHKLVKLKSRKQNLLIQLKQIKQQARQRQIQKNSLIKIRQAIESLVSCQLLSKQALSDLRCKLFSLPVADQLHISRQYFSTDSPFSTLLESYFENILFKQLSQDNSNFMQLSEQIFTLFKINTSDECTCLMDNLFEKAIKATKKHLISHDLSENSINILITHLCYCFSSQAQVKQICSLLTYCPSNVKTLDPGTVHSNNNVDKLIDDSNKLIQQNASLLVNQPLIQFNRQTITQEILENLKNCTIKLGENYAK